VSVENPCLEGVKDSWESVRLELAAELLRDFGDLRFRACGGSMLPTIFPGDDLMVRREPIGGIRRGNVVLSRRAGRFYAHRVVRIENRGSGAYLITRGDALAYEDLPTSENELLGLIPALIRRGKRIELSGAPNAAGRLLQWAVRHSELLARALLRWHASKVRFARDRPAHQPELRWTIGEGH
jgi:hypothetical protein